MSDATFELRKIFIATENGLFEVFALVHGPLAVFEDRAGDWSLTELGTGMRVSAFDLWEDACKAACRLSEIDWSRVCEEGHPDQAATKGRVALVLSQVRAESDLFIVAGSPN